ncbi:hypothetical protein CBF23_001245 [Marinomonas agarivorans]|nr:hypothetical protein CBF23_001245 [Marinomonas agarivorans]
MQILDRLVPSACRINYDKLPALSVLLVITLPLLLGLFWWPTITSILQTQQQVKKQLRHQQNPLEAPQLDRETGFSTHALSWLNQHAWLHWQVLLPTEKAKSRIYEMENEPALHLSGLASYEQWQTVVTKLVADQPSVPMIFTMTWQGNGLVKANLHLQVKQHQIEAGPSFPLFIIPKHTLQPWPENMALTAVLNWQQAWHASLQLGALSIPLQQGMWVPELSATLVNLDQKGALFRQYYFDKNQSGQARLRHQDKLLLLNNTKNR